VKAPPTTGPHARPSWPIPMLIPWNNGRRSLGTQLAMVVRQPVNRPEEPRPAMARPRMNIVDDCAAPHMADPSSKTKKKARKVHWGRVRLSQASGLEGRQSTYLEGEIGVDLATQWLEGSACQLIGTRVPTDVYQGVEFGSNGGRCGGNDGQVEEKEIVCHGDAC